MNCAGSPCPQSAHRAPSPLLPLFGDPALEARYQAAWESDNLRALCSSYLLGIAIVLLWLPFDSWFAPTAAALMMSLRVVAALILAAAMIASRLLIRSDRTRGHVLIGAATMFGVLSAIIAGAPEVHEPAAVLNPHALFLFYTWLFAVVRLPGRAGIPIALLAAATFLALLATTAVRHDDPLPAAWSCGAACAAVITVLGFGVGCSMIIGLDRTARSAFRERHLSERLLDMLLPPRAVERLRLDPKATVVDRHEDVTVVFIDLVGFTGLTTVIGPDRLMRLLDEVFSRFDVIVKEHGLYKIKTIGDAYMAAAGLPDPLEDHTSQAAAATIEMRRALSEVATHHGVALTMRAGIHRGPVIAGVIGHERPTYDIWGETVNIASRMESHAETGRIQLSDVARAALAPGFVLVPRGALEVKGRRGWMRAWYLEDGDLEATLQRPHRAPSGEPSEPWVHLTAPRTRPRTRDKRRVPAATRSARGVTASGSGRP